MSDRAEKYFSSLKNKSITVVGFGVSNRPLIDMLLSFGANVTVRDKKSVSQLGETAEKLADRVKFITGESYLEDLSGDIVFKTPGMRRDLPQFREAECKGITLTSEMEVFFELADCHLISVTGSEGKSTTTTVIYNLLKEQGYNAYLGGNLGFPLLPHIFELKPEDYVIAELSSFQLSDMQKSASIAVITNIVEEHLNWHTSMEEYIDAKKNVFRYQDKDGRVILNKDYQTTASLSTDVNSQVYEFSIKTPVSKGAYLDSDGFLVHTDESGSVRIMHRDRIKIKGDHNVENYLAAIAATWGLVDISSYRKVASEFGGIRHRMEFIREVGGVKYFNDSIATSPTAAIAGLKAQPQKIIMIAGGSDKNLDYSQIAPYVMTHVKHLILTGQTADKIHAAVTGFSGYDPSLLTVEFADGMEAAVKKASSAAVQGDIVYLIPVSASFDSYSNFEQRGDHFRDIVNKL